MNILRNVAAIIAAFFLQVFVNALVVFCFLWTTTDLPRWAFWVLWLSIAHVVLAFAMAAPVIVAWWIGKRSTALMIWTVVVLSLWRLWYMLGFPLELEGLQYWGVIVLQGLCLLYTLMMANTIHKDYSS
ncbi:MAG: hypothetical protein IPP83_18360 [Flavobacteriales bacterium]|nr:hypothetical protein [Flavobacteriales bacterium]